MHLGFRQKYSATRCIYNSLLAVWKLDETLSLVFDVLQEYQRANNKSIQSNKQGNKDGEDSDGIQFKLFPT